MHYLAYVLIPADGSPDAHVERLMAPHCESNNCERGFWDFWQIGGRWTGYLSGVDPAKDPLNHERCPLCRMTPGVRYDLDPEGKPCNGCTHGADADLAAGVRVKWPTQWVTDLGDVLSAPFNITDEKLPHTLVLEGNASQSEAWDGNSFVPNAEHEATCRHALSTHTGRLVIVDYHC